MPNRDKILEQIKDILIDELLIQINKKDINYNTSLIKDLGLDSIQILEFIVVLENEFAIRIEDEDLEYKLFNSISSLVDYISSKMKQ